jgi:hypothetical protein
MNGVSCMNSRLAAYGGCGSGLRHPVLFGPILTRACLLSALLWLLCPSLYLAPELLLVLSFPLSPASHNAAPSCRHCPAAQVGVPISRMCHHPATGLLAAACDDLVIRMYDVEARRLVRRFRGHADRISDLQLSSDCRWLLSASLDNTVRVWDVPGEAGGQ